MSLATRCTACGTIFRVVQDQLKVSHGWVRCGRCREVFNALEGLFDLDRDTPPDWSAQRPGFGVAAPPQNPSSDTFLTETPGEEVEPDPFLVDRIDAQIFGSRRTEVERAPSTHVAPRDQHDFADAQFEPELLNSDSRQDFGGALDNAVPAFAANRHEPAPAPEFVRSAERQARWQSPLARVALSSVASLLLAGLALQMGHHFRDTIAAHWPQTRSALFEWCSIAHCSIEPPRRIEDISVESTALTRAPGPDAFRLSVTLRNRAAVPLALPSVDLSLTDPAGQLVARRALAPQDFGATSQVLAAGAELNLQLILSAGSPRVSGYTVEVFYP